MKYISIMLLLILVNLCSATDIYTGSISGSWDLTGSPYNIFGNIDIPADQSLNIDPGVEIIFQGHYKFYVYGKLTAVGALNDSILFSAQDPDAGWYGLHFSDTSSNGQDDSILMHCVFEYGNALTGSAENSRGGALSCFNSSNVNIAFCRFSNNQADYGGAISLNESDITIQNSLIDNNFASHDAGGMLIGGNSAPILDNITVSNNLCNYDGGGIFCSSNSSPIITNSIFQYNSAIDYYDGSGGAISCWNSTLFMSDTEISFNYARQDGGGIEIAYDSSAELENVLITHNNSSGSGGLDVYSSFVSLAGVTVSYNTSMYSAGGIDFSYNSSATFDSANRSNIYLNNSLNSYNTGNDLKTSQSMNFDVIVDTFTVLAPTETQASPLSSFSFDILNGMIQPVESNLYVSPNGSDFNSGLTPNDPLQKIYTALQMIEPSISNPLTIYLEDGIYSPSTTGDAFPLEMKSYLTISGTSRDQTILDADQSNKLIYCTEKFDVNVENLTLTNGFDQNSGGGAIYCWDTDINLENILIINNTSKHSGGGISLNECDNPQLTNVKIIGNETQSYLGGGGIYCYYSNPILNNVDIIENNSFSSGGGIYFHQSYPVFDPNGSCNIYLNNVDFNSGKDLSTNNTSTIDIIVDTFTVIQPEDYFASPIENFNFTISNAIIQQEDNDLFVNPTGSNSNTGLTPEDPLQTINMALNKIISNESDPHTIFLAEGVYSASNSSEIFPLQARSYITFSGTDRATTILDAENECNVFICNDIIELGINNITITNGFDVYDYSGYYGYNSGGGINMFNSEDVSIRNVIISNNTAGQGAGLYCYDTNLNVSDAVFYNNHTSSLFGNSKGGAMYCSSYNNDQIYLVLSNLTIINNSAQTNGGAIHLQYINALMLNTICRDNEPQQIYLDGYNNESSFIVTNSNIDGGLEGIINDDYGAINWIEGNIDEDPLFLDPLNNNYYLQNTSPCIDAGTAFFEWNGEVFVDLDEDEYFGSAPDMGGFEWNGTPANDELEVVSFELRNFPNPFNPETKISFSIPEDSKVELNIYNIKGQKVKQLLCDQISAGQHSLNWNGKDNSEKQVSSGIYFYQLKTSNKVLMKKMILLK